MISLSQENHHTDDVCLIGFRPSSLELSWFTSPKAPKPIVLSPMRSLIIFSIPSKDTEKIPMKICTQLELWKRAPEPNMDMLNIKLYFHIFVLFG